MREDQLDHLGFLGVVLMDEGKGEKRDAGTADDVWRSGRRREEMFDEVLVVRCDGEEDEREAFVSVLESRLVDIPAEGQ